MLGPIKHDENRSLPDLFPRERLIVYPLLFLVFAIGLYPRPLFAVLDQPVREILKGCRRRRMDQSPNPEPLLPASFIPAK